MPGGSVLARLLVAAPTSSTLATGALRSRSGSGRSGRRRDWPGLAATLATAALVEVGLRTMRLPTLASLCGAPLWDQPEAPSPPTTRSLHCISDADRRRLRLCVRVCDRWPADEKCLRLALVSAWRIRHHRPRLVVGVALDGGQVAAHAWLAVDGVSLNPSDSGDFLHLVPVGGR